MEVIKQKVHLVNDQPAWKSGEWPGVNPSHWKSSKMILKPFNFSNGNTYSKIYFLDEFSHRKNFIQAYAKLSEAKDYKPHKKCLTHTIIKYDDLNPKKHGLKYIEPHYTEPKTYERKMLSYNIKIIEEKPQKKQTVERCTISNPDYFVDEIMGKKKRLNSVLERRNFHPLISPGDKIYKNVEYQPGFFKLEGLVVGSTNRYNYNKSSPLKADNFYETLDLKIPSLDPNKLWKNKLVQERIKNDSNYVKRSVQDWEDANSELYIQHEEVPMRKGTDTRKNTMGSPKKNKS